MRISSIDDFELALLKSRSRSSIHGGIVKGRLSIGVEENTFLVCRDFGNNPWKGPLLRKKTRSRG